MNKAIRYNGEWQQGSTVSQKLEGPIGYGSAEFENGDIFEGMFLLSYASINGPAYLAHGRYTFADGRYIENAWINTSKEVEKFALKGVYEIRNADGTLSSITSFLDNMRHGVEVVVADKSEAIEWYMDKECGRYGVSEYTVEAKDKDRREVTILLDNEVIVKMICGRLVDNGRGNWIFDNYLMGCIYYTNGNIYTSVNYGIRNLEAYNGWGTLHSKITGKCSDQLYKDGVLEESEDEEWSDMVSSIVTLPHPTRPDIKMKAKVWGRHIKYDGYGLVYDGDVVDNIPNGKGVLSVNGEYSLDGDFKDGLCDGHLKITSLFYKNSAEGEWRDGKPVNAPQSVTLHYCDVVENCTIGGSCTEKSRNEGTTVVTARSELRIFKWDDIFVMETAENHILFLGGRVLPRGGKICFSYSTDGYEDHEGVVWDTNEHTLTLEWRE